MNDAYGDHEWDELPPAVLSYAVDEIAMCALQARAERAPCCHACDEPIAGEPAGSGLLVWTRGDDVRLEEPPLCFACAAAIGMSAQRVFEVEEEEG